MANFSFCPDPDVHTNMRIWTNGFIRLFRSITALPVLTMLIQFCLPQQQQENIVSSWPLILNQSGYHKRQQFFGTLGSVPWAPHLDEKSMIKCVVCLLSLAKLSLRMASSTSSPIRSQSWTLTNLSQLFHSQLVRSTRLTKWTKQQWRLKVNKEKRH